MKGLDREECWMFCLNRSNYLTSHERVSVGGMDATNFDTRIILRKALERKTNGIILVHNHPSGNPKPSKSDLLSTQSLKKGLEAVGIAFLDHIIVCDDCYFSFSDGKVSNKFAKNSKSV